MNKINFIKYVIAILCVHIAYCAEQPAGDSTSDVPNQEEARETFLAFPNGYKAGIALDERTGRIVQYFKLTGGKPLAFSNSSLRHFVRGNDVYMYPVDLYKKSDQEPVSENGSESEYHYEGEIVSSQEKVREPSPWVWLPDNGSILGTSCYIWELPEWEKLGKLIKERKAPYILTAPCAKWSELFDSQNGGLAPITNGQYVVVDQPLYEKFAEMKKDWEKKRAEYPCVRIHYKGVFFPYATRYNDSINNERKELVYADEIVFDRKSGRILTYLLYTANEPRSAKLHLLNNFTKINSPSQVLTASLYAVDKNDEDPFNCSECEKCFLEEEKSVHPLAAAESFIGGTSDSDTGDIHNNVFTMQRGMIFGGECFIWDLYAWKIMGEKFKNSSEPYYLRIACSDVKPCCLCEEEFKSYKLIPEIKLESTYLKVDRELYAEMEKLRQNYQNIEKEFKKNNAKELELDEKYSRKADQMVKDLIQKKFKQKE